MKKYPYPTLTALFEELRILEGIGQLVSGASRLAGGGKFCFKRGRDIGRLSWPGLGDFYLDRPQQQVVAMLLDAMVSGQTPDVPEAAILRAIGSGQSGLRELFVGTLAEGAWGTLIVPGREPGDVRLAAPRGEHADADEGDDEPRTHDEWVK